MAELEAARARWEREDSPDACRRYASALLRIRQHEQALHVLDTMAGRVPADPALLRRRALALRGLGRWDAAAEAFEAAARAEEGCAAAGGTSPAADSATGPRPAASGPPARSAWARAEALACRLHDLTPAAAAEALRRILLVGSVAENPYAVALYGRLLLRADRPAEAARELSRAAARLPDAVEIASLHAFAVRRVRGPLAAMPLLMAALSRQPAQPAVLATLVNDARRTGQRERVRRFLIGLARAAPGVGGLWRAAARLNGPGPPGTAWPPDDQWVGGRPSRSGR